MMNSKIVKLMISGAQETPNAAAISRSDPTYMLVFLPTLKTKVKEDKRLSFVAYHQLQYVKQFESYFCLTFNHPSMVSLCQYKTVDSKWILVLCTYLSEDQPKRISPTRTPK
jgi:hypothetical protein